jgi:glyoxylase-like metal-dependent hydrolase (beta-lactamase superfamily II)
MTYLEDEKVLFASDGIMPVPSIAAGDMEVFRASLQRLADLDIESIVQGHGEVILRGEVRRVIDAELSYLDEIEAQVARVIAEGEEKDTLRQITLESIGRSRIPLNGLVQQIHLANLNALYNQMAS